jgi:hypothetical protein
MNKTTTESAITISPEEDFEFFWANNNELRINFLNNFSYNTSYSLTIGEATSDLGIILNGWPMIIIFKTEVKQKIQPTFPTIKIISPKNGTTIKPNEIITIIGSSTGLEMGAIINVRFDSITESTQIGPDGNWSIIIRVPEIQGNYTLNVTFGNFTDSVSIIIYDPEKKVDNVDEDKPEKGEDQGLFGMGSMVDLLILLGIIFVIVIIVLFITITRKRSKEMDRKDELTKDEFEDKEFEEE